MWNVLSVDFLSFALLFFFSNIICNLKINISFPFLPYSDNSSFANIYIYIERERHTSIKNNINNLPFRLADICVSVIVLFVVAVLRWVDWGVAGSCANGVLEVIMIILIIYIHR